MNQQFLGNQIEPADGTPIDGRSFEITLFPVSKPSEKPFGHANHAIDNTQQAVELLRPH